jgi:hypothetical protein
MKKIIALLLVVVMIAGMMSGCGAKKDASGDTGKLVLYSSWAEDRVNPLVQGFTELTGIEVSVVTGGTSELINRIVAEKDNPLGDVLWGGSTSSYGPIKDYLMTYDTTEILILCSIYGCCKVAERRAALDSRCADIRRDTSAVEGITTCTHTIHTTLNNATLDS